jgi:hypothetical protein
MVQQELRDDAGRDCDEYVIAARLNPLMSGRRGAEIVAAPVIDDVISVAVFGWQAISAVILVVRAHAATITTRLLVRASEAAIVVLDCRSDGTLLLSPLVTAALVLVAVALVGAAFVSVAVALREGKLSCGHRQCDDRGNSCISVHLSSK